MLRWFQMFYQGFLSRIVRCWETLTKRMTLFYHFPFNNINFNFEICVKLQTISFATVKSQPWFRTGHIKWPRASILPTFFQRQKKIQMKVLLWTFFNILVGSPLSAIPVKLRSYQNVTGIDDFKLMNIFERSMEGINFIFL